MPKSARKNVMHLKKAKRLFWKLKRSKNIVFKNLKKTTKMFLEI